MVPIVVVEVRDLPGHGRVFTTADGQLWIQSTGQRSVYADPPFRAEIKPGALGSFFLVPLDRGHSVRVRRNE